VFCLAGHATQMAVQPFLVAGFAEVMRETEVGAEVQSVG
jgi:hypothetical protein